MLLDQFLWVAIRNGGGRYGWLAHVMKRGDAMLQWKFRQPTISQE